MSRERKTKVATWRYSDREIKLDIPVFMLNKGNESEPDTSFRVSLAEPEIELEDTNIDRLKKKVFAQIKEKASIAWQTKLHITIDGDVQHMLDEDGHLEIEVGASVGINCRRVQIAMLGRKKIYRRFEGVREEREPGQPFNRTGRYVDQWGTTEQGWPETGEEKPGKHQYHDPDKRRRMLALIDDTPESRAALEAIGQGFGALVDRLRDLCSPDKIQHTLANLSASGMPMLPAPETKEKPRSGKT